MPTFIVRSVNSGAFSADGVISRIGDSWVEVHNDSTMPAEGLPSIDSIVNSSYTTARNQPQPRDPLVLDLDCGGITIIALKPNAAILFGVEGDGIKTGTGWIGAGEAIVVRDLNGNGTIDSGRELFGDATVLTRGPVACTQATNSFAALADLDVNAAGVADGKFDANDVALASVKLWKDLNQNGTSEGDQKFTFAALGVQSINIAATASNVNLGGGNTQSFTGTFTRVGGATGGVGTTDLVGSLLLSSNNFCREFTDGSVLTLDATALPEMRGGGWARDFRGRSAYGTNDRVPS